MAMHPFGLDISDSVIRLVTLERHHKGYRVPVRGEIPVPVGVIVDGDFIKRDVVRDILEQLVTAAKPRGKQAIVTLPERHSFIKVVTLPPDTAVNDAAIQEAVTPHLPYAWSDVTFDWRKLPASPKQVGTRILFGGAPKTIVTQYLETLTSAGIEIVSMEIESIAIARAMLAPDSTGAHIVLDLGRTRASLILVSDGVVEFSTTLRYSGKDLNQYIADALRISTDQAQKAKEMFGLDPERGKGLLARILSPQLDLLAEKVRGVESYYQEHFPNEPEISTILLNGSGALIRAIDHELGARLDKKVIVQPSWIIQQMSSDPTIVHDIAFTYTTALGLAMQPFTAS